VLRLEWVLTSYYIEDIKGILNRLNVRGAVFLPLVHTIGLNQEDYDANPLEREQCMLVVYCPASLKDTLLADIQSLQAGQYIGATRLEG
jgi:hypothetical protein